MQKIIIKIDVSKIDKSKIKTETFTTKEGETVTKKILELEAVPLNETKLIKDGDTYQLHKTHFIAESQTKEERVNKVKSKIIGDGLMFTNKPKVETQEDIYPTEELDPNDIPFK